MAGCVCLAWARLRSAARIRSGEPVITVGKKRVTPVANILFNEAAISSAAARGEL